MDPDPVARKGMLMDLILIRSIAASWDERT